MKPSWKSLISLLLVLVFVFQLFPASVLAVEADGTDEETIRGEQSLENESSAPEREKTYIIGEVDDLREESAKQFRMNDGTFVAVEYESPVHYQDANGEWQDIDNTVREVKGTYVIENGDMKKTFSSSLSDGKLFDLKYLDHRISLSLVATEEELSHILPEPTPSSIPVIIEPNSPSDTDEESFIEKVIDNEEKPEEMSEATPASEAESESEPNADEEDPQEVLEASTPAPEDKPEIEFPSIPAETTKDGTKYLRVQSADVKATIENPVRKDRDPSKATMDEMIAPEMFNSEVTYENALRNTDIVYSNHGYNLKESILVKEKLDSYCYYFSLSLSNLKPQLQKDGSIILLDSNNSTVFEIPAPYMFDAKGAVSKKVEYSLSESNTGYILTVNADPEWINESDRSFPVTIDPTILIHNNGGVHTAMIRHNAPNSTSPNFADQYCGYYNNSSYGICEVVVQVESMPTLPQNCVVVNAAVMMSHAGFFTSGFGNATTGSLIIQAKKLNNPATSVTALTKNIVYNTLGINDTVLDHQTLTYSTRNTYVSWDVTSAALEWISTTQSKGAILLSPHDSQTQQRFGNLVGHAGSNSPYFAVQYRNTVGLEDYYTYEQASAGSAGNVYIENFSNKYTIERQDTSLDLATTSFDITHYYNSGCSGNYCTTYFDAFITNDYWNMLLGDGWKLSVQQTIVQKTIGRDTYLVYMDADGTQHYFAQYGSSSTTFKDEDGLGLTIIKSTSGGNTIYTMKDTDAYNTWVFHNGYLISQTDHNGNAIYIAYNNNYSTSSSSWKPTAVGSNRIVQVVQHTDSSGAPFITVASFEYDSNNFLSKMTDYAGRVTKYYYSNSHLVRIENPDGTTAVYGYNPANADLISAYDSESKYGLEFALTASTLYGFTHRTLYLISEYSDQSGSKKYGHRIEFVRNGNQMTTVHDYGPDHAQNTSDDLFTYNAFDYFGRTITSYTTNYENSKMLGVAAGTYIANNTTNPEKNNRLRKTANSGQHVNNLLLDSGLEYNLSNSGWVKDTSPDNTALANAIVGTSYSYGYGHYTGDVYPHMGQKQLKTFLGNTIDPATDYAYLEQGISLTSGKTYTLSAYINTSTMRDFDASHPEYGSFLAFMDQNKAIKARSEIIHYHTEHTIEKGWERISVTYTPTYTGTHYLAACQKGAKGITVYDDLQLELNDTMSCVNLIQDSGFDRSSGTTYWNPMNPVDLGSGHGQVIKLTGSLTSQKRVDQTVNINQPSGTTFLLSGWGKANSVFFATKDEDTSYDRFFGLVALITYADSETETQYVPFSPMYDGWQYCSGVVVPKRAGQTVKTIKVSCAYDKNANTAWFDDISLIREPAQTYVYDSKGNPTMVTSDQAETHCEYYSNSGQLKKCISPSGSIRTFTYLSNTNNVATETMNNVTTTTGYNSSGGVTSKVTQKSGSSIFLKTTQGYDTSQNHRISATDFNGVITNYGYNSTTHNLTSVQRGTLPSQAYSYLPGNNRMKQTYISGYDSIQYGYDYGRLNTLTRKGFTSVGGTTGFWQKYGLTYDAFGNNTSVTINGSTDGSTYSSTKKLIGYTYESSLNGTTVNNGRLSKMTYANGNNVTYSYDVFDRITSETYNNGKNYRYYYDSDGNLSKQAAVLNGNNTETYIYDYDSLGRLIHSKELDANGDMALRTEHLYDTSNRLEKQSWMFRDGVTGSQSYVYNENDDTLTTLASRIPVGPTNYAPTVSYSYNDLRQLTRKTTGSRFYRAFSYKAGNETNQITAQVLYMNYRKADDTLLVGYKYAYNGNGNISAVYHSLATGGASSTADQTYTYDVLGQLTKCVDNIAGRTYTYSYDTAGNIKTMNGGAGGNKTLTYGGDIWKDRLTKVQVGSTSENITYETAASGYISGNPISYYNGRHYDFTWQQGRQLASAAVGSVTATYSYDMAGVRSSKTVGSTTYNYDTLSGLVMHQSWGVRNLYFLYDDSNQPYAVVYRYGTNNPAMYYYLLNQQGDVIGLLDSSSNIKALYRYDPWGGVTVLNPDGTTNTSSTFIGNMNPLRYRGYYYDTETGLYYLQSRYYDPAIGRFINADTFATTDADGFLSCNMFAYCENNPVDQVDSEGTFALPALVGGAVAGAVVGAASAIINAAIEGKPVSGEEVLLGALSGAVSVMIAGASLGARIWASVGVGTVSALNSKSNGGDLYDIGSAFVTASLGTFVGSYLPSAASAQGAYAAVSGIITNGSIEGLSSTIRAIHRGTTTKSSCAKTTKKRQYSGKSHNTKSTHPRRALV